MAHAIRAVLLAMAITACFFDMRPSSFVIQAEAKIRHARTYPEDEVERMLAVGPDPMTAEEWERTYCR
jgi:hypothetical protein